MQLKKDEQDIANRVGGFTPSSLFRCLETSKSNLKDSDPAVINRIAEIQNNLLDYYRYSVYELFIKRFEKPISLEEQELMQRKKEADILFNKTIQMTNNPETRHINHVEAIIGSLVMGKKAKKALQDFRQNPENRQIDDKQQELFYKIKHYGLEEALERTYQSIYLRSENPDMRAYLDCIIQPAFFKTFIQENFDGKECPYYFLVSNNNPDAFRGDRKSYYNDSNVDDPFQLALMYPQSVSFKRDSEIMRVNITEHFLGEVFTEDRLWKLLSTWYLKHIFNTEQHEIYSQALRDEARKQTLEFNQEDFFPTPPYFTKLLIMYALKCTDYAAPERCNPLINKFQKIAKHERMFPAASGSKIPCPFKSAIMFINYLHQTVQEEKRGNIDEHVMPAVQMHVANKLKHLLEDSVSTGIFSTKKQVSNPEDRATIQMIINTIEQDKAIDIHRKQNKEYLIFREFYDWFALDNQAWFHHLIDQINQINQNTINDFVENFFGNLDEETLSLIKEYLVNGLLDLDFKQFFDVQTFQEKIKLLIYDFLNISADDTGFDL